MGYNILAVDDSATVRAVINKTLQMAGVEVDHFYQAAHGQEALAIVEENWVDLIFTDINMPVMGGIELIERLASDGMLKTIPVVIISTEGSATRIEQLKAKGVCAYLRKPFAPEQLRSVVENLLGVRDAE